MPSKPWMMNFQIKQATKLQPRLKITTYFSYLCLRKTQINQVLCL